MADLFDVVVARKLSGGGGGSSDFSTATVTLVGSPTTAFFTGRDGEDKYTVGLLNTENGYLDTAELADYLSGGGTTTFNIVIVSGRDDPCIILQNEPSIAGNASKELSASDAWIVTFTGDCTITIS